MKAIIRFYLAISVIALLSAATYGETTIYTTNFGTGGTSLPTGWSASSGTGTWAISTASASSGYTGASASNNVVVTMGSALATHSLTFNNSLSTVGYQGITVMWGARKTSTCSTAVSLSWSSDGSTWNSVSYTEVGTTGSWALSNGGTRITLPAGAEGLSNLQLRWTVTQVAGSGTYRIDDFNVQGTASGPTITLNTSSFVGAFQVTKVGNSSSTSSFTVSGTSLAGDITVTPPTGFQIRTGANAFSTTPVTLTQTGGVVTATTIDVQFTPLAYIKYSGSIACASSGAGTQYASVSGTGGIKSVAAGNWSSGTTWDGGTVPNSTQNVYIASAYPVTIDDGTAACLSIDFDPAGTSGLLVMGSSSSVLSVYGDFTLGNTSQMVFASSWPSGAKLKFTGSAATQVLSGWNTSTTNSGGLMEVQIDKSSGKVTTSTLNMKLTIGTSLEIINGTFEIAATDDIFGRDLTGTATTPTILIQSGGTFTIVAGATQMNSGYTNGSSAYNPIGKMTVFGTAELVTTSTSKLNIGGIDVESGGVLRLLTGGSSSTIASGLITVKSGGTLRYSTTLSTMWDNTNSSLVLNSGGSINSTVSSAITLPTAFTDNGGTFRYSYSTDQTGVLPRTYTNLELSGGGIKTLGGSVTVNGTLSLLGSATLALGSGSLAFGASGTLQYGASGQATAQTTTDAEWPAISGPLNVQIYNGNGVTLHANRTVNGTLTLTLGTFDNDGTAGDVALTLGNGATISRARGSLTASPIFGTSVNVSYTSSIENVTSGFELPTSTSLLNNLNITSTQGMTLSTNATVNGVLTLSNTNITTGSNILTIGSTGSVTRGSGYIAGQLSKSIGTGANTKLFEIGSENGYSPVTVAFGNVTTAANLSASVTQTTHPSATVPANTLNRYWTIAADGELAFDNYSATFTYLPVDFNTGVVEASDESSLMVGKYAASWSFPTLGTLMPGGTADGGSIQAIGLTSFSDFAIAKEGSALPVEMTTFSATQQGSNSVILRWKTATEINNMGFEIIRRIEGSQAETKVGFVEGKGNSNSPNEYLFTDKKLAGNGKYVYRLKQLDSDGSYSYSRETALDVNVIPKTFALVQNYPNPFNPTTKVGYQLPSSARVSIELYSILGSRVTTLVDQFLTAGEYSFELNTTSMQLASGVYLIKMQAFDEGAKNTFSKTIKIVLNK